MVFKQTTFLGNHHDSEGWELVLFEIFKSSYLWKKKVFSAHFSPIFSKVVSTFNKIFQFELSF